MSHRLLFSPAAVRDFRALPRDVQTRLKPRIDALANDPRPSGCRKLSGEDELYRIRVGDYRVLYAVRDQVLVVLVVRVGNRRDVYRKL